MTAESPHIQRLKRAGCRLTQARLTVLAVLEAEHGHITSADVLEKVESVNPAVGRASVFRTLDLFTRLGIIRPTYIDTSLTPTYVMMRDGIIIMSSAPNASASSNSTTAAWKGCRRTWKRRWTCASVVICWSFMVCARIVNQGRQRPHRR